MAAAGEASLVRHHGGDKQHAVYHSLPPILFFHDSFLLRELFVLDAERDCSTLAFHFPRSPTELERWVYQRLLATGWKPLMVWTACGIYLMLNKFIFLYLPGDVKWPLCCSFSCALRGAVKISLMTRKFKGCHKRNIGSCQRHVAVRLWHMQSSVLMLNVRKHDISREPVITVTSKTMLRIMALIRHTFPFSNSSFISLLDVHYLRALWLLNLLKMK